MKPNNNDLYHNLILNYINNQPNQNTTVVPFPIDILNSIPSNLQNEFSPFPATSVAPENISTFDSPEDNFISPLTSSHISQNDFQISSDDSNNLISENSNSQNQFDPFPETSMTSSNQIVHQNFQHDTTYLSNHIINPESQNEFSPFPETSVAPETNSNKQKSDMISIQDLIGDDDE